MVVGPSHGRYAPKPVMPPPLTIPSQQPIAYTTANRLKIGLLEDQIGFPLNTCMVTLCMCRVGNEPRQIPSDTPAQSGDVAQHAQAALQAGTYHSGLCPSAADDASPHTRARVLHPNHECTCR